MNTETLPPADHPAGEELHTVGEVATLARVTVRTLHHYDRIGLLVPSRRSENGYRLYGYEDLERLRQILLLRELGFGLDAIGQMLDAGAYDQRRALIAQRELLRERQHRTERIIAGVDRALEAMEEERPMAKAQMFEGLEDFDHEQYEDEARERWGETNAYKQSMRRTRRYSKDDWTRIKAEAEDVMARLAALLEEGAHAASSAARELAEQHRCHIDRWFYPCSHAMHAGLADMYVADPRFTEYFEKRGQGLAAFFREAILANAARRRNAP
ncbi:MAG: MerR family transcriptional regulator [Gammaproteobacteria bacterium]|nr:MerR family transcriptional regulator [Gammaproteobacteria bacterium]